jgi:hypothetical protein
MGTASTSMSALNAELTMNQSGNAKIAAKNAAAMDNTARSSLT